MRLVSHNESGLAATAITTSSAANQHPSSSAMTSPLWPPHFPPPRHKEGRSGPAPSHVKAELVQSNGLAAVAITTSSTANQRSFSAVTPNDVTSLAPYFPPPRHQEGQLGRALREGRACQIKRIGCRCDNDVINSQSTLFLCCNP